MYNGHVSHQAAQSQAFARQSYNNNQCGRQHSCLPSRPCERGQSSNSHGYRLSLNNVQPSGVKLASNGQKLAFQAHTYKK